MIKPIRTIRIEGPIAYVPLTKGLEAVIDAIDAELVGQWNWHASMSASGHVYALRNNNADGVRRTVAMHVQIMGLDASRREVDHRDGDGLNNRRANLRHCTHAENMRNRMLDRRNRFGAKGVWASRGKFRASIKFEGKTIHLGTFQTQQEAAAAYLGAAKALFGDFARAA